MTIPGNSQENITFALTLTGPGTHTIGLENLTKTVEVKNVPSPPVFNISGLQVSPNKVADGQDVSISAMVTNSGETSGTYEVTLKIKDIPIETIQITLDGYSTQSISFNYRPNTAGNYDIDVNGLKGTHSCLREASGMVCCSDYSGWYLFFCGNFNTRSETCAPLSGLRVFFKLLFRPLPVGREFEPSQIEFSPQTISIASPKL